MRKDAPVQLDEDIVDDIMDMTQIEVVEKWNDSLDKLSRRPKTWDRVKQSMKTYKLSVIELSTVLYPMTPAGWRDFIDRYGSEEAARLIADAHPDVFSTGDWFMLVIGGHLVSYDEDEQGICYPLALFLKALGYRPGGFDGKLFKL